MRTTVELPDELFRQIKARAALQGRSLKELVADGLKLLLQTPTAEQPPIQHAKFPIIRTAEPKRRVTMEMVADAEKRLLEEEAMSHGRLAGH